MRASRGDHRPMRGTSLRVALLLALAFPAAAAHAVDSSVEDELQASIELIQARQRIKAEDYSAALELLGAARARTPENADIHSLLSFATRKLGRLDEAYAHYQLALRLDPDHRGAREYLGELHLQRGELDLAREQLTELERLCPEGCEERGELEEAIQAHEESTASR
jgi:tetratricopeptide (TPR) repeat protein